MTMNQCSFLHAKLENLCGFLCVFDSSMLPSAIIFLHLYLLSAAVPSETMDVAFTVFKEMRNFGEK